MSKILEGLNPEQRAAVENFNTPSLIIAGAGSGKTRVLTARIAYMIENGVSPHSILALTFTKKAAEQMRERISKMLPDGRSRMLVMGTFHAVFSRILRDNAERLGYPKTFTIYDSSESKTLIKSIIKDMNLPDNYKPNSIHSRISYAKNSLVTPEAYAGISTFIAEDREARIPEFSNIYTTYCQRCKRNGAMDFDDLLLQTNILFRDHADILARYQEAFGYILVDEYQDTNFAQYTIIRRVAEKHRRVAVVGDDAQSIYSFRGAKIENILNFRKDYPEAKTFKLEQNYRSTRNIVDAANSVIEHNKNRMDKSCFSQGERGEAITLFGEYTENLEAERVASSIIERINTCDANLNEIAVLYRTNHQSQAIEKALRARGLQYKIYKGNSFFDHKEIKDLVAYIRLVINPRDDEALKRIINTPARGIGGTTVERIEMIAQQRGVSMWEAITALIEENPTDTVQKAIVRKVMEFAELIKDMALNRGEMSLFDYGHMIAKRSTLISFYSQLPPPEGVSAVNNIEEILNTMQSFNEEREADIRAGLHEEEDVATLEQWLESVMLSSDMDGKEEEAEAEKITLMTVHSSKGLEYDYVYIVGMEENLFPSQMATESGNIEEERRLFYVALTRAKIAATLSFAETRFKWGKVEFTHPSQFLRNIDPQYLDMQGLEPSKLQRRGQTAPKDEAMQGLRKQYDARSQQRAKGYQSSYGAKYKSAGEPRGEYKRETPRPIVDVPKPNVQNMRSVGVRRGGHVEDAPSMVEVQYAVGDRVTHAQFGVGEVRRVETLVTDCKIVIHFEKVGEKTLLSKFAKLTKL